MLTNGDISFQWDKRKAASNKDKHGVTFEEAASVFSDVWALVIDDPDHSEDEHRFVIIGLSLQAQVLTVCHCYREGSDIRIISARQATKTEAKQYWKRRSQ